MINDDICAKKILIDSDCRRICSDIKGWRMVKSETRLDAETLVRNPSPRLFGKKVRDSKKVKTNHAKRDFETYQNASEISRSC